MEAGKNVVSGFKGFDKGLKCRGFQFKEGETFIHEGKAQACSSGFHYCENPLDVFRYYSPSKGSKYHLVEGTGEISRHESDSKVACSELSVHAEVTLSEMIKFGVKYIWKRATDTTKPTSGYNSSAATSGYNSSAATSGYNSSAATSGNYSSAATSGNYSSAATSGYNSSAATSGYNSSAATSGYNSSAATSGDCSSAATSGDCSSAATSGDCSSAATSGDCSPAVCAGVNSRAKAGKYGCVALAWWNEKEERAEMRCAEVGCGDGSDGKLKSSVWYRLDKGGCFYEDKNQD